mmetsp:Transcript_28883/g.33220  ORF Transcript_28883/g.33220 Transcript_28883/m.33220 type:complete len:202 (-) Transcript_28883:1275-1880(-)
MRHDEFCFLHSDIHWYFMCLLFQHSTFLVVRLHLCTVVNSWSFLCACGNFGHLIIFGIVFSSSSLPCWLMRGAASIIIVFQASKFFGIFDIVCFLKSHRTMLALAYFRKHILVIFYCAFHVFLRLIFIIITSTLEVRMITSTTRPKRNHGQRSQGYYDQTQNRPPQSINNTRAGCFVHGQFINGTDTFTAHQLQSGIDHVR